MIDRRNIKWIVLAAGSFLVLAVILLILHQKHSPDYTQKIVSQDTGEIAYSQPNKTPETAAGHGEIILFGSYLILDNGATQDQFSLIKQAFSDYASKKLHNQYDSLTLLPQTFQSKAGNMKSTLRLGDTDKTIKADIKVWQLKYAQLVIHDQSGANGGNYDSGTLTVPQQSGE